MVHAIETDLQEMRNEAQRFVANQTVISFAKQLMEIYRSL
jgi:hypothetical protein